MSEGRFQKELQIHSLHIIHGHDLKEEEEKKDGRGGREAW
jgi:hypothetical protein